MSWAQVRVASTRQDSGLEESLGVRSSGAQARDQPAHEVPLALTVPEVLAYLMRPPATIFKPTSLYKKYRCPPH
jgi:hypothetical protein